jgi:hypothetical protein
MAKYIDYCVKAEGLAKISSEYGQAPKGVLGHGDYVVVGKHAKDRCESIHSAITVQGSDIGQEFLICSDKECTTHFGEHSHYRTTPQEQAKRKKQREREAAAEAKFNAVVATALDRVTWPLHSEMLDTLLDIALADTGTSFLMPIVKRHGLKADKTKDGRDYKAPIRRLADEGGKDGKLRMLFELHLPSYSGYAGDGELKKRIAKL